MGSHEKCCKSVHLLLFQRSLHRDLLAEAQMLGTQTCVMAVCAGWMGTYLSLQALFFDFLTETMYLWAMGPTLCLIWPCVCNFQITQKTMNNTLWTKEECAVMWDNNCHLTPAEDTHSVVVFTLYSRAHSPLFLVLLMVLLVLQIAFLVFLSAEASLLKKFNSYWSWQRKQRIQVRTWVLAEQN